MTNEEMKRLLEEIKDIKSLLILLLQKLKISNVKIGKVLGLNKGNVSKLLDKKKYKKVV